MKIHLDLIIGARPNIIKVFPLIKSIIVSKDFKFRLIHTGQHYDPLMSDIILKNFGLSKYIEHLNIKNNNPNQFIAETIINYSNKIIKTYRPDFSVVFGDVNSTLAIALASNKLNIPLIHIEAGLRSYDKTMPEEHNRIVTDHLSEILFTTTNQARLNLIKENIDRKKIYHVGNIMIETLLKKFNVLVKNKSSRKKKYVIITIHRPSNTGNKNIIEKYLNAICSSVPSGVLIIFPVHHSVRKYLDTTKWINIKFIDPLPYIDFIKMISKAYCVVTDSGGISEETTILNIPCLTLRSNTERPETIKFGTNILIGNDMNKLKKSLNKIFNNKWKNGKKIKYWDNEVSVKILNVIRNYK